MPGYQVKLMQKTVYLWRNPSWSDFYLLSLLFLHLKSRIHNTHPQGYWKEFVPFVKYETVILQGESLVTGFPHRQS